MLKTDNEATDDLLGRDNFAKQIVNSLTKSFLGNNENLVIGINGKWGSGKSTLLSYIKRHLQLHYKEEPDNYKILEFNSWANTGEEALEREFLEAILSTLVAVDWKKAAAGANERFKSYLKYLDYIKFVKHVHPMAKSIFDTLDEYKSRTTVHSLVDIKLQADQLLRDNEIKLYILIDDLDRLTPTEITTLFRVLKVNLNLSNTFYIIAYDKEVVINALETQYQTNGERYLEKIIQVDFTIPQILESQIEELFFTRLRTFLESLGISLSETKLYTTWRYRGLKEFFKSMRDLNRYFNSLIFSLPNIQEEINVEDFLALEAIKVFDYEAYEQLYKDILIHKRKAVWTSTSFNESVIALYKNETTQALLKYLFAENGVYSVKESPSEKRLKDPEFFERYYALSIATIDVTEENVARFFGDNFEKMDLLKGILDNNKMKSFLRRLSDPKISSYYKICNESSLRSFMRFWDSQKDRVDRELDELIWNSYFNLAHNFEDKHKGAVIAVQDLVLNPHDSQPIRFVFNHYIHIFRNTGRADRYLHSQVQEQIEVYKDELQRNFLQYLAHNRGSYAWQIRNDYATWIANLFMFSLAKFTPKEYLEEFNTQYINQPKLLAYIIENNFLMYDTETMKPSMPIFDHKEVFFPGDTFQKCVDRLENLIPGELDNRSESIVSGFLRLVREV